MTKLASQELIPTIVTQTNGLYRLQPDVILVLQDGVARILGLNRGRFYGLDAIGTKMLTLLFEQSPEMAASQLATEYGVPEAQVLADINKLLQNLQKQQLLVCQTTQSLYPTPPSSFTTSLLLTLAWISIRTLGWTRTIKLWRRWQRSVEYNTHKEDREKALQAVDTVVRSAAAKHMLLPMVCKERALVGWQILRTTFGLPAELVIGINFYPFEAHAWVECGSEIVTDDPLHCKKFIPAARYS